MTDIKKISSVKPINEDMGLGRLLADLFDQRWLVIGITSLCVVIGITYALFSTPIYRADALVQIEQNEANSLLTNISEMLPGAQPPSEAEIELIKSRMVLGKTVDDLTLNITVEQKYFPIFGERWAALTGEPKYTIQLSKFSLPEGIDEDKADIKIIDNKNYIFIIDGEEKFKGKVAQFETKDGSSILVNKIDAKPGTVFIVTKKTRLTTIANILDRLVVVDKGKDTGVISTSYTDTDPQRASNVLNSISQNYLLQNIERNSAEAGKSLDFLKLQLPKVRSELDQAEDRLNLFRQQNDSVDLTLEAKSALDYGVSLDAQLDELTFKEAEISKLYTKEHPSYRALLEQRKILEDEKSDLNKKIANLPKTQQEILKLTRDAESAQAIYMQLLNKQQELSITKASTVGNVRIIDAAATTPKPVEPKVVLVLIVSVFLGGMLSVCIVLVNSTFRKGIESPEQLEDLGINVYASIPISEWQRKKDLEIKIKDSKGANLDLLLASGNPTDLAVEAIRSLRTSLHFAMMEAKNNTLMIAGASPAIGKTFVSANLAAVIAQSGSKVLLIDGDMRKGYMHGILGCERNEGLSDILLGSNTAEEVIKETKIQNLFFISRGTTPPNPAELLMHKRLEKLLDDMNKLYDIILIDTPPILAVTDAAIIGRYVGISLIVARFEVNTPKEVEVSIKRFEQNGVEIKGVIVNAMVKKMSNYYGYYQYSYGKK